MAQSIYEVLMKRDGITEEDAKEVVADAQSEMEDAIACGDFELAEDIMMCDLGLEMDYIFDILF